MSETQGGNAPQKISGVFSSQEIKKVGTGTTTRKTIQKTFWFCTENDDGSLEVQPLNPNYIPSGPKKNVKREQFLTHYAPEPEIYISTVYPKMREVNKVVARAERYRANSELYSAEMEYANALKIDDENVRANFGLGITYLERGDNDKAQNVFSRIVKLDAAFEEEHKHLFNDFGIKLRKNGMVDQALTYYERALELAGQDENLLYNLARAWLEKKDIAKCLEYLLKSLAVNPRLDPAVKFLIWLDAKKLVPEDKKQDVSAALAEIRGRGGPPESAPATPGTVPHPAGEGS
ncbi:MAG: tetratricopeptide repeat protein [Desulfovibrio sp.]|jgi:tetratricopeptide (TPR) repeat protein|nr:tetratricopeptide repeat protein [Desulfovibrio sp.]